MGVSMDHGEVTMRAESASRSGAEFREVRAKYFNKSALPASTLVQVTRLANPAFLLEVEAIAILPPKAG